MKHEMNIQETIDDGLQVINDCLLMTREHIAAGSYDMQEMLGYSSSIARTLEKISKISQKQEGSSLNNSLATWIFSSENVAHPFNLLKNQLFLPQQRNILSETDWEKTKIVLNIGGRQSGKTAAAAQQFLGALHSRFNRKLHTGQVWEGWMNYSEREKYEPYIDSLIIAPKEALTKRTSEYIMKNLTLANALDLIDRDITTKKGGIWLHGGVRIQIVTGSNENNIMGKALDVVMIDEMARMTELIYEQTLKPALLTKSGILIGSTTILKGEHWFIDIIRSGLEKSSELWVKNQENYSKNRDARPRVMVYFHHTKDNTFIENIEQELEVLKKTMPPFIYEQEIDGIWKINEDIVFSEFDAEKHVQRRTKQLEKNIINSAAFTSIGLDIGFSSAKENAGQTAMVVTAFSRYPKSLEDTEYIVLASAGSSQIPFLSEYWAEVLQKYCSDFGVKYIFYDNAKKSIIDSFRKTYAVENIAKWIPASKTLMPGIEHMKQLFFLGKIDIIEGEGNTGEDSLVNDIKNYKWKKDTLQRVQLEPAVNYSDRPDAMRYSVVTPYFKQLGVK